MGNSSNSGPTNQNSLGHGDLGPDRLQCPSTEELKLTSQRRRRSSALRISSKLTSQTRWKSYASAPPQLPCRLSLQCHRRGYLPGLRRLASPLSRRRSRLLLLLPQPHGARRRFLVGFEGWGFGVSGILVEGISEENIGAKICREPGKSRTRTPAHQIQAAAGDARFVVQHASVAVACSRSTRTSRG